jgi:glyoxylase-like metal-dependent hydrolase (beta-lactamase superfamily II)
VTAPAELREVASELWIAEAPLRYYGFEMGRLMVVVRLTNGGLLVHSPAELTRELRAALDGLGEVRFVVPASSLHGHLHMEHYQEAYPQAKLFAAPGLEAKRPDLRFSGRLLDGSEPDWNDDLEQVAFEGHGRFTEVEFLHPRTRTLIAGDLVFNIGPQWPLETRRLAWGPEMLRRLGPTEAFRAGIEDERAARLSIDRILGLDFDRILPGHGEIVESNGKEALRQGLRHWF